MKRHVAGTIVPPGLYWRTRPWDLRVVSFGAGLLEGVRGDGYLRIPPVAIPLAAIAGLVLGGLYVVLLPLVGAVMLLVTGAARVGRWLAAPRGLRASVPRKLGE